MHNFEVIIIINNNIIIIIIIIMFAPTQLRTQKLHHITA